MLNKTIVIAAILIMLAYVPAIGQNLVANNAGFENPSVTNGVFLEYYNGANPTGWTLSGTGTVSGVGAYVTILKAGGAWWSNRDAAEGSQFMCLSAYYGPGYVERSFPTISQSIATVPGTSYRIRFAACANPGAPGPSSVRVRFGSLDQITGSIQNYDTHGWTYYEYLATASSSSTTISFTRQNSETCIDDTSITETVAVSLNNLSIVGPARPTEAEMLAIRHLNNRLKKITGRTLPVRWSSSAPTSRSLIVGNRATLGTHIQSIVTPPSVHADLAADAENQSYAVIASPPGLGQSVIVAGLGRDRSNRGTIGISYAIGMLLRNLNIDSNGQWSFLLPAKTTVKSPAIPVRDLYIQNSWGGYPGISIEQFSEKEIEDYVDFVIDSGYSRVSFWMWHQIYMHPDNYKTWSPSYISAVVSEYGLYTWSMREYALNSHEKMKYYLNYAKRRGLEIYHMITPAHVPIDTLPGNISQWAGIGYYGASGGCWNKPEVRELAKQCCRIEMEYFAPVDGYTIWYYDPGGCFCSYCKPNQAAQLFSQTKLVSDIGDQVSPGASYTIGIAPAFVFAENAFYTQQEMDIWMPNFLSQIHNYYGTGGKRIMISDHGENEQSGLYIGWVNSTWFMKQPMLYSTYGMMCEYGYVVPHIRFGYIHQNLVQRAMNHQTEGGVIMTAHSAINKPGVYAAGYGMYEQPSSWQEMAQAYARYIAKGESYQPFLDIVLADESVQNVGNDPSEQYQPESNYVKQDGYITDMENAWNRLAAKEHYLGDPDQLRGFVKAQRYYWRLAKCTNQSEFTNIANAFKADLSAIPMYTHYMTKVPSSQDLAFHAKWVWRWWVWDRNNDTGL